MGFFDDLLPQIATAGAALGSKGKKPTGVPQQQPLPITPTLPQGGYNRTPSTASGPTTAQIFAPLINRMAGGANQSSMNRKTMDGTGTGLSTNESWNGMFAHGAKDLSPEQLRASQGSTAMNQWQDPSHYVGSRPGNLDNADAAAMASPGMFHIQGSRHDPTLRDNVASELGAETAIPRANASPAPNFQIPSEVAPIGSPQPNFNFGTEMIGGGVSGAPTAPIPKPSASVPPAMFGPSALEMAWPPTSPKQKLRQNVAKAADIRANQVTQPDWGAAPMF